MIFCFGGFNVEYGGKVEIFGVRDRGRKGSVVSKVENFRVFFRLSWLILKTKLNKKYIYLDLFGILVNF